VSIKTYLAVQDHSKASGADYVFLLVMARWADDQGICHPSVPALARCCHVSERSVQETMGRLIELGELKLLEKGGGRATNTYQILCVTRAVQSTAPVKRKVVSGAVHRTAAVQSTAPVKRKVVSGAVHRTAAVQSTAPKEPDKNQGRTRGGGGTPPPQTPAGNPKPETKSLWPAMQPYSAQALVDKHARWWTELLHPENPKPDRSPEEEALIDAALVRIGGTARILGFRERPRDASFAREEFLDYLRRHDPVYQAAAERLRQSAQNLRQSLGEARKKPKAKARGAPG